MGKLILVRHGQASAFTDDYDRLSDLGRRQAELLAESWKERGLEVALVFSGPLKRQKGTAEIVGESFQKSGLLFPEPVILEGLKEIDADQVMAHFNEKRSEYPELERLITAYGENDQPGEKAAIFQEYFEQAMLLWVTGKVNSREIESLAHLKERVIESLERILIDGPGEKETIVVFTSATPVSIITGSLLELDDFKTMEITFCLNNCSVTEFALKTRGPVLNSFNCTGHLPAEMVTLR
jgi:broad specificity phosphatase PhoE